MTTQPAASPRGALVWGVAVPVLLWAVVVAALAGLVPRFEPILVRLDGKSELSALGAAVLAASHWVRNYWYVLPLDLPFLVPLDVLLVLWLWRSGRRGLARAWCALMVALPIAAGVLVVAGLHLPEFHDPAPAQRLERAGWPPMMAVSRQ